MANNSEKAAIRQKGQEAVLLMTKGCFKEAEPVIREALSQTREQNNAETFMWMQRLTECLIGLEKFSEAEPFALKAVQGFRRYGQDDEDMLDCKYLLAECLHGQRKHPEAAELAESTLESLQSNPTRGGEHPTTLRCKSLLAYELKVQGKCAKAKVLAQENEQVFQSVWSKAEATQAQGSRRLSLAEVRAFERVESLTTRVLHEGEGKLKRISTIETVSTDVPDSDGGGSKASSRAPSKTAPMNS